jgi:hypothetical protein
MYGGLFGDLPAAKKGGKPDNVDDAAGTSPPSGVGTNHDDNKTNTSQLPFAPPQAAAARKRDKVGGVSGGGPSSMGVAKPIGKNSGGGIGGSSSIVQTLGQAGTSMAFVPTALKKRKKPSQRLAKVLETPTFAAPVSTTTTAVAVAAASAAETQTASSAAAAEQTDRPNGPTTTDATSCHEMVATTTIIRPSSERDTGIINIHQDPSKVHRPVSSSGFDATDGDEEDGQYGDATNGGQQQQPPPPPPHRDGSTVPLHHHYYDHHPHHDDHPSATDITDPYGKLRVQGDDMYVSTLQFINIVH